tara:strand:+ start:1411 stop:1584 length:174 start_codon:yes stop_codon:yes gene_type:complete
LTAPQQLAVLVQNFGLNVVDAAMNFLNLEARPGDQARFAVEVNPDSMSGLQRRLHVQ